jgi:hypothetical protein
MTTNVYSDDQAAAREMIADAGLLTTVRRRQQGTYNPLTGPSAADPTIEARLHIVVLPVSPPMTESVESRAYIRTHRRRVLAAVPVGQFWTLAPADEIFFQDIWWTVRGVAPLNPNDAGTLLFDSEVEAS